MAWGNICKPGLFLWQTLKTAEKEQFVLLDGYYSEWPWIRFAQYHMQEKGENIGRKKSSDLGGSELNPIRKWMFRFSLLFVFASFVSLRRLRSNLTNWLSSYLGQWQWLSEPLKWRMKPGGGELHILHFNTLSTLSKQHFIDWSWPAMLWKTQSDSHILSVKVFTPLGF